MEQVLQKHRGVAFDKRRNTWFATIKVCGKNKYLGAYSDLNEAITRRLEAEKEFQSPIIEKRVKFELDIANFYNKKHTLKECMEKFKLHQSSIRDILIKNNIQLRTNEVDVDLDSVYKMYSNNKTIQHISKTIGVSDGCIRRKLKLHGINIRPNKKYDMDESIFEKIDSEWKSYYLGLFYADAGLQLNNVKLSLHEKDKELIDCLNNIIYDGKYNLYYTKPSTFLSKSTNKYYNKNGQYSICINRKKVVNDLIKLGCGLRKSLTLKFPSYDIIPKHLFNHFLRGYFDGDGCIQFRSFHIISSDDFCIRFQKWMMDEMEIESYLKKQQKISRIFVHKQENIKKMYHFLYDNATIFLTRKKNKFISLGYDK